MDKRIEYITFSENEMQIRFRKSVNFLNMMLMMLELEYFYSLNTDGVRRGQFHKQESELQSWTKHKANG